MGKLITGLEISVGAVVGKNLGGYVNTAAPYNVPIPGTGKSVNVASFALGTAITGFGPRTGLMGNIVQGVGAGIAAGSDPNSGQMGGGAMRGASLSYGSIGV